MMKFLDKLIFPQPANDALPAIRQGEIKEHPNVEKLRKEAKAKMEQWGRKSLLDGGEFSLNNKVLKRA